MDVRRTDRLLDSLGSRSGAVPPGDDVAAALAAWAVEIDAAEPASRSATRITARRRSRLRRTVTGGALTLAMLTGSSVAAALTGTDIPALSDVGRLVVAWMPGDAEVAPGRDDQGVDARPAAPAPHDHLAPDDHDAAGSTGTGDPRPEASSAGRGEGPPAVAAWTGEDLPVVAPVAAELGTEAGGSPDPRGGAVAPSPAPAVAPGHAEADDSAPTDARAERPPSAAADDRSGSARGDEEPAATATATGAAPDAAVDAAPGAALDATPGEQGRAGPPEDRILPPSAADRARAAVGPVAPAPPRPVPPRDPEVEQTEVVPGVPSDGPAADGTPPGAPPGRAGQGTAPVLPLPAVPPDRTP